jgi:hypothetical protein
LSAKLLKNGTLKTYKDFPHGMPTTEAATINADLLAFPKGVMLELGLESQFLVVTCHVSDLEGAAGSEAPAAEIDPRRHELFYRTASCLAISRMKRGRHRAECSIFSSAVD